MRKPYPHAKTIDVKDTYFGTVVEDPYRWLEQAENQEVLDFVAAQNQYTAAFFKERKDIDIEACIEEQKKKGQTPFYSDLIRDGKEFYAVKTLDGNYSYVKLDENFRELETILDRDALNHEMNLFSARQCPARPELFAFYVLKNQAARPSVLLYDVTAKKRLCCFDSIFYFCWSEDGGQLIFSDAEVDKENNRNVNRVCIYDLKTQRIKTVYQYNRNSVLMDVAADEDGGIFVQVYLTYGDGLLVYIAPDGSCTELTGTKGMCDYVGEENGICYFITDVNTPFRKVVALSKADLRMEHAMERKAWDILPETDAMLEACGVTEEGLLTVYQKDAVSSLLLYGRNGSLIRKIKLPSEYGNLTSSRYLEARNGEIFFTFESFICPQSVLVYHDGSTEAKVLYRQKRQQDVSDIEVCQQFIAARDGCRILAYLVYPKNAKHPMPVMMYGYGGYGASMPPWYQNMVTGTDIVDWVKKGRMYVHCIIRGGSEYGSKWHEDGMLKNKKHAFEDFIDIAQWLVENGLTVPRQITATGLSNGGLLMTAVTVMRPDLFGTVIASVPHTDMLRFCRDDRGPMYITEYGDPMTEEMFEYMYSYSPYHNIKKDVEYPAVYIQTGEYDNNVPPYHGKKFAARLQANAKPEHPVLLRVLPEGSHDRGSGDYYYQTVSEMQMFIEISLAEK